MIKKLEELMVGQTVEKVELESYQAPNDTLILTLVGSNFSGKIKIKSDPNHTFDGLAFYVVQELT